MARTQAGYQPAALGGPLGLQAPLNGISVAEAVEPLAQVVARTAAPSSSGLHCEAMLAVSAKQPAESWGFACSRDGALARWTLRAMRGRDWGDRDGHRRRALRMAGRARSRARAGALG